MGFDRQFLLWALAYLAGGMCLGIYMAASQNHGQLVTHAHINLVGFLLSFCYGIMHKLWLGQPALWLARVQFVLHQLATLVMVSGLFLLYGHFFPAAQLEPVLAPASLGLLASALLMLVMVLKANRTAA